MQRYFLRLFDFDMWANMRLFQALTQLPSEQVPPRAQAVFSHLLATHHIWHARIAGETPTLAVWPDWPIEAWTSELSAMVWRNQQLLSAMRHEADFFRQVSYANTKGVRFTTSVEDILTHLLTHSSYHQGQIVTLLKGIVEPLPDVIYITYVREKSAHL